MPRAPAPTLVVDRTAPARPGRWVVCAACAVWTAVGCAPEFTPASFIEAERVLAIRTTPPEASPGQQVHLDALVASPQGTLVEGTDYEGAWWRCPDSDSDALEDFWECTKPSARRTLGKGGTYDDVVPPDLFGAVPAAGEDFEPGAKLFGALFGYWRVVGFELRAGDRTVDAFKRTPIFSPLPLSVVDARLQPVDTRIDEEGNVVRNTNPVLTGVAVHERSPDGPTTRRLEPGKTYFLEPRYDEDVLESYLSLKVDLAGLDVDAPETLAKLPPAEILERFTRVERCEVPVFSWYATAGALARETTLDERVVAGLFAARGAACPPVEGEVRRPEVRYVAPSGATADPEDQIPSDGVVHAWVVLRDGRGGTDFREFTLTVGDEP